MMEARAWIDATLGRHGLMRYGTLEEVHVRPWSIVLRVPANDGDYFFKTVLPAFAFEPALTAALAAWRPDDIPAILGINRERRWMLMGDGGCTLRQAFAQGAERQLWRGALSRYAGLQVDLANRVESLLALGTRDRRLAMLPALVAALLEDRRWLLIDEPKGLTTAEYRRLLAAVPEVSAMCQALAGYAIPESLHHNDLHDANIFYHDGTYRFFDWGDSSLSHPFFSLRTVLVSIENRWGPTDDDPQNEALVSSYLQPWRQYESEENLWAAYHLARQLWSLSSAIKYHTQLRAVEDLHEVFAGAIPALLQEFLAANPQLT